MKLVDIQRRTLGLYKQSLVFSVKKSTFGKFNVSQNTSRRAHSCFYGPNKKQDASCLTHI